MLQSKLFGESSNSWYTNCAQKFLKIPQDQLTMIDNIPEWSTKNSLTTGEISADKGVHVQTIESEPLSKAVTEKEKFSYSNSSEENIKLKEMNDFILQFEKIVRDSSKRKQLLSRSVSLSSLNQLDNSLDHFKLRSSNSAPNINKMVMSVNKPVYFKRRKFCIFDPVGKVDGAESNEIPQNNTYIVPAELEEMEICTPNLSQSNKGKKITRPFEKLGNHILNHKFIKGSSNSVASKSDDSELPSNAAIQISHNPLLDKRLMLLEKRFSPSKEYYVLPAEENLKHNLHSDNIQSQKFSEPISELSKGTELFEGKDMLDSIYNNNNLKVTLKASVALNKTPVIQKPVKDAAIDTSAHCASLPLTTVSVIHEECFGSQPIPCGQPVPLDVNLLNKCVKGTSKSTHIKDNIFVKVHQDATEHVEKSKDIKVHNSDVIQGPSAQRKRKSKTEMPKKLEKTKHAKIIEIHFTVDQVKNMLEIMKIFNLEA